jgi:hypothetical protein
MSLAPPSICLHAPLVLVSITWLRDLQLQCWPLTTLRGAQKERKHTRLLDA